MCWDSPIVRWLCRHSHFLRSYCWQANKRGLVSKRQKSPLFLSSRAGAQTQVSQVPKPMSFFSYWWKLRPSEAEASLRAASQGWWEMTLTVHHGRSRGTPRTSHALGKTPSSTSQMHQFFFKFPDMSFSLFMSVTDRIPGLTPRKELLFQILIFIRCCEFPFLTASPWPQLLKFFNSVP